MITGSVNIMSQIVLPITRGESHVTVLFQLKNGLFVGGTVWSVDTDEEDPDQWDVMISTDYGAASYRLRDIEAIVQFPLGNPV